MEELIQKVNETNASLVDALLKHKNKIYTLKAENERLKEKIESYACSQNCYAYKRADKYLTTLQDIKAIAKKTIHIYYPDYYDEGFKEDIVTEFAKQVLDLITKAEEE